MSAEAQSSGEPFVAYAAGEGDGLSWGPKIVGRAEWTNGAYLTITTEVPPGFLAPVHKHLRHSQTCIVVSGTVGFWVEGEEDAIRGAGSYVFRPKDRYHGLWNPGDEAARIFEITTPATDFQEWLYVQSDIRSRDDLGEEEIAERVAAAGIVYAPEITKELGDRLGLSVPRPVGP